ncbi:hypothetical protein BGZ51_000651 [Haplosporangium sp. Z 767]|nr:hypothetical protein BGZ51_000651 [Haplosporangium sp. Z 767]
MHPSTSTVSDWIQNSATFDKTESSSFQPFEVQQQQQQSLYYDLQQLCMSQSQQDDLDISVLPSLVSATDVKPAGYDTSSIASFSSIAPLAQGHHITTTAFMDSALWPQLTTNSLSLLGHPLTAIEDESKSQLPCTTSIVGPNPMPYNNPYSVLTTAFPSATTFATPAVNITMDSFGSNELFSALHPWSQVYTQASLAISTVSPSPSLSPSSTHSSILPSPCSSSYSLSPSSFIKSSSPARSAFEQHLNPSPVSYKLTPTTSSILTRRRSQALLALKQSSCHSFTSHSNTATSATPTLSTSVSSLTCQVCKKRYANNSTLRRHLKIHAYANSSSHAMSLLRSASINSSSSSVSSSPLMRSTQPAAWPLAMDTSATPMPSSSMVHGYNPGSDPDIKKPECVGCNKAFARRDTVILHIKNQKRKWDLLSAMLPDLTAAATSSSLMTESLQLSAESTKEVAIRYKEGTNYRRRRVQRQRRSHPYRMIEKLWQSTLQKKGFVLSTTNSSNNLKAKMERRDENNQNDDDGEMKLEEREGEGKYHQNQSGGGGGAEEYSMEVEDEEEEDGGGSEDGWSSMETILQMDSKTKLQWMMKMMVLPPCWKERKVRLFGAFGVLEEKVLQ